MKKTSLPEFANWDIKTVKVFSLHLQDYEAIPRSKTLLASMIKFEEMYQPLAPGPFQVDYLGTLAGENEYRQAKRSRIYLNKKDLIKAVDSLGGKRLILTTRAHKIFYEDYPLSRLRKEKWNGFWTVVFYDFPEKLRTDRNYLRRKLKYLGFGSPQESVLVSPLPLEEAVRELIEGERMEDYVWVLSAQRVLGLENEVVAEKAWNLEDLNQLYEKLLEILPKVKESKNKNLLDEWKKYFLAIDAADPYLPAELLTEDWLGEKCRKAFSRLGLKELLKSIFD